MIFFTPAEKCAAPPSDVPQDVSQGCLGIIRIFLDDSRNAMNSALFHAARPGDIRSGGMGRRGGGGDRPGMREAAAMAKEMGFDQDFGPQVGCVGSSTVFLESKTRGYLANSKQSLWTVDKSCDPLTPLLLYALALCFTMLLVTRSSCCSSSCIYLSTVHPPRAPLTCRGSSR